MSNDERGSAVVSLRAARDGDALRVVCAARPGAVLVEELRLAFGPLARARGLLGRPPLAERAGILLRPCRAVHTWFMRTPIDVLFLDESGRVVGLERELPPWRMTTLHGAALATLELAAGRASRVAVALGDELWLVRRWQGVEER